MIQSGLNKILPHRKDFSFLHSFGAIGYDIQTLPEDFTIYDGRPIPNQNAIDTRFTPGRRPIPYGCTGETQTFAAGLEDTDLYLPDDFYFATPPGTDGEGRDLRASLETTTSRGFMKVGGTIGNKRTAYFTCYGAGAIDDFDAARIAIYINQSEKRGVSVGSWWYEQEFGQPVNFILPTPSFNTQLGTLHNWLITGWKDINGEPYLEVISWQGTEYGNNGIVYMSRAIFNALMAQPYTGAYTITKVTSQTPIPIGMQAYVDHLVAFIRQLFHL